MLHQLKMSFLLTIQKKEHVKYTYGPTFLLQFKDKLNVKADAEWVQSTASKIVIPPGMGREIDLEILADSAIILVVAMTLEIPQ
nr:ALI_HP1_G0023470.mRNA.1.CDS.1 [Saccharomyces cerevisiae]